MDKIIRQQWCFWIKSRYFIPLMQQVYKSYLAINQSCSALCNIAHTDLIQPEILMGDLNINTMAKSQMIDFFFFLILSQYILSHRPTLFGSYFITWILDLATVREKLLIANFTVVHVHVCHCRGMVLDSHLCIWVMSWRLISKKKQTNTALASEIGFSVMLLEFCPLSLISLSFMLPSSCPPSNDDRIKKLFF